MSNQIPSISSEESKEKFDDKMRKLANAAKEKETEQASRKAGVLYINLAGFPIGGEAIQIIDEKDARRLKMACFFIVGEEFRVGAVNPNGEGVRELFESLEKKLDAHGKIYMISEQSLEHALKIYAAIPKFRPMSKGVAIAEEDLEKFGQGLRSFEHLEEKLKGVSTTDFVTFVIAAGLQSGASDIHIEAEENAIVVRFRIDGTLHTVATVSKEDWNKIISRLKLLSGLKLNIDKQPQDGRFTIIIQSGNVDVRVSTIPISSGESVVMRILKSTAAGLKFEDIGLRGKAFEQLKIEIGRPNGMIITTGPTGSGKTTTLYAILNKLNNSETKIITIEDPIEYKLNGISQSQVDPSKNYTFASGLKSILRQDPDVLMVGEIRDLETVEIAIQAALTGHLVLSTIHTNSAAGAIPRFIALGSKPFLLSPALNSVIGQRLVRKICENCKEAENVSEDKLKRIKDILSQIPDNKIDLASLKFYKGRGCSKCFSLGYKGRIGIYEIMVMNKEIEDVILSGKVSEYVMQEIAIKNGMITMVQDGLLKALDGITSVDEVFSVAE